MDECIFCKIVRGEMPAAIVYKDEQVTAFRDIHPVAPTHILVVPNQHISSTNDVLTQDEQLLGHILTVVKPIAEEQGIVQTRLPLDHQHRPGCPSGGLPPAPAHHRGATYAPSDGINKSAPQSHQDTKSRNFFIACL